MAIDRYLAMTAAEIGAAPALPPGLGYMACHFSPYTTGLSNLPASLPEGSLLILNDRTPIHGHDPERIAAQLTELIAQLKCHRVLLDLQRPGEAETIALVKKLANALPCPVGVSEPYAAGLNCPVFLPPVPPDTPVKAHLAPWEGREVWLEAALDSLYIHLTPDGASRSPAAGPLSGTSHHDDTLHCHYHIHTAPDHAGFTLWRTPKDLEELLKEAEGLGVTVSVGLYQEMGSIW